MSIIVAIILGGIIGTIAAKIMGRQEGMVSSIVIGIVGSFIGDLISSLFTGSNKSFLSFSWMGLAWSLVGSIILVAVLNAVSHPKHHTV